MQLPLKAKGLYSMTDMGTLGMPGFGNQQLYYQLVENFDAPYSRKKSDLSLTSFFKYCCAILLLLAIWACLVYSPKAIVSTCMKPCSLSAYKKINLIPNLFLEIWHFFDPFCSSGTK